VAAIRTVPETGSTNDDVAALARDGAPEGLWLRADRQSGGKGRQGRAWQSPPGNLYASTFVRVDPKHPPPPSLALVAAVALHEAVSRHTGRAQIKWPNDIIVNRAKLAGILLERQGDAVVIGFGVNLAHHPEDLDRPAASLGARVTPEALLRRLAASFEIWLERWRTQGLAPVRAAWLAAAHPIGTPLVSGGTEGTFDGLDETGALRLKLADGAIRVVHAGDVFLV
jgi:BirA family transcriptional regulator, biotin operon repressor / biotin---[acetyl-CoA-carboxylase] ligase